MDMDNANINRQLLSRLQNGFPMDAEPFAALGKILNVSEEEVITRIERLKTEGIIRQISPVFDARRLGYHTTLVAMKVDGANQKKAEETIRENPCISHGYEREHPFNLWFTLAMPDLDAIEAEMRKIGAAIPADTIFQLPATRLYKIGAYFGEGAGEAPGTGKSTTGRLLAAAVLSDDDRRVINALQHDLPMEKAPFTGMAEGTGMDEAAFLSRCRSLLDRGIMRRYGAAVNHRRAGYTANGMACWAVPAAKAGALGRQLASRREVSHCYLRETNPEWPYNLFAMIHGKEKGTCIEIARQASAEHGLQENTILFSTREIKKVRIKYPV